VSGAGNTEGRPRAAFAKSVDTRSQRAAGEAVHHQFWFECASMSGTLPQTGGCPVEPSGTVPYQPKQGDLVSDMTRTLSRGVRNPRLWALPLSAVALLGAVELGCVHLFGSGFVLGTNVCADNSERLTRLSSAALLPARPPGATALEGHPDAGGECVDDSSGDPWIVVEHYYRYDGDQKALIAHYRRTAAQSGWTPGGHLCFGREVSGEPASLSLSFDSAKTFRLSVESTLDGTPMDC